MHFKLHCVVVRGGGGLFARATAHECMHCKLHCEVIHGGGGLFARATLTAHILNACIVSCTVW